MGIIQSRRRTRQRHRSFLPFVRKKNKTTPAQTENNSKKASDIATVEPGKASYNEQDDLSRKPSAISSFGLDDASTTTSNNASFLTKKSGASLLRNDSTRSSFSRKDSAASTTSVLSSPGSPRGKKSIDFTRSIEVSPSKKTSFRKANLEKKSKKKKLPPLQKASIMEENAKKSPLVEKVRKGRSRTFALGQPAFMKNFFTTKSSTKKHRDSPIAKDILTMEQVSMIDKVKLDLDEDGSKMINEYTMIRTIGEGSFGKVKLCMDENNRAFAIKIMDKKYLKRSSSPAGHSMYESVLGEIDIMKKARHPNIIRLYEVINAPEHGKLYLIMEPAQNGTVLDMENSNNDDNEPVQPLSPLKARRYLLDLVKAMIYLHNNNIAHRDIKPENLLLDDEDTLKVSDFGVSKQLGEQNEKLSYTLGTPAFMPPESHEGNAFDQKRADIWSIGVTLFVFLFGKLPFYADTLPLLQKAIKEDPLKVPEAATPNTKSLLENLLQKDPLKRISLAEILYHPWITSENHSNVPYNVTELEGKKEEVVGPIQPKEPSYPSIAAIANIKLGAAAQLRRTRSRSRTIVGTPPRSRIHTPSTVQLVNNADSPSNNLFSTPASSFVNPTIGE